MPKKGPRQDWEYADMARRFLDDPEGLASAADSRAWRDFVETKLRLTGKAGKTPEALEAQLSGAEKGRQLVLARYPERGIQFVVFQRRWGKQPVWRDIRTGRWIPRAIAQKALEFPAGRVSFFRYLRRGERRVGIRDPMTGRILFAP